MDPAPPLGDGRGRPPAAPRRRPLIAFSDGDDDDGNGFADDIVGWDFLDDDNDAYDDVQYGHGTGEARDSTAEADNGGDAGSCPNCMSMPLRVGDSFIADVNRFAQAVIYATDNGVLVIQEALGTLNNARSRAGGRVRLRPRRDGHRVGRRRGRTAPQLAVELPARDRRQLGHAVRRRAHAEPLLPAVQRLHELLVQDHGRDPEHELLLRRDRRGAGHGGPGLQRRAERARRRRARPAPDLRARRRRACVMSANEVRQLMASGTIDGVAQADDVNFATQPEPSCTPVPAADLHRPEPRRRPANRPVPSPLATTKRYPARKGHDQFYGYGRVNMNRASRRVAGRRDPARGRDHVARVVRAGRPDAGRRSRCAARCSRAAAVHLRLGRARLSPTTADDRHPPGDFQPVASSWCDGERAHGAFDGVLATRRRRRAEGALPGKRPALQRPEPAPGRANFNGRPNTEPYGFVVKVVATLEAAGGDALTGQDRRNLYLHRDQDMLPGFPKTLPERRRVVAGARRPRRRQPQRADRRRPPTASCTRTAATAASCPAGRCAATPAAAHRRRAPSPAARSSRRLGGAILASVAVGDLDRDGAPEVVAADLEGKLYVWDADGELRFKREANLDYSGASRWRRSSTCAAGNRYRTQHGFLGSPVLADLDGDGGGGSRSSRRTWTATSTRGTTTAPRSTASRCWWSTAPRSRRSTRRRTRRPSPPRAATSTRARSSTRPRSAT